MIERAATEDPRKRYHRRMQDLLESDPQIRAMAPKDEISQTIKQPGLSLASIIDSILSGYSHRSALAERTYDIESHLETGAKFRRYEQSYTTITYDQLRARVEALANAWRHHDDHRLKVDDYVCVFGFSGVDFTVVELACAYSQAITVPLQSNLASAELGNILRTTGTSTLVAAIDDISSVTTLAIDNGCITSIVAIDYDGRVTEERRCFAAAQAAIKQAAANIKLTHLAELVDFGKSYHWQHLPPHPSGEERVASIMHSSGSTGAPKGLVVSERIARHAWTAGVQQASVPIVGMVFAPMNHMMGRYTVFGGLAVGGTCYYTAKRDLSTLFEDIRLARPTFVSFFPRVFELIYQYYQSEVIRRVKAGEGSKEDVDTLVRQEMRAGFLGDRLRGGSIGSAPTTPGVEEFVRDCFDIMLFNGYGSSEGGIVITVDGRVARPPVIDYKLLDVPELGYYSTDKPYPRGELLVRSHLQFSSYFKNPEATAAVFDKDGYVRTGDIMEERGADHIVYIDRRNDVLKLSNAEFVAAGSLGTTFESSSAVIKQIYIYGNSARSYLLGVVVPDMGVATSMIGHEPSEVELKALLRSEMQGVAKTQHLRAFEVPRDFLIEMEPFSYENGLLSSVRKRVRPKFKEKYGDHLEALYDQVERKRAEELQTLKDPSTSLTVLEKLVKALEASLGIAGIDPETELNFSELGGDSLGSVSFSMFIEEIFGVSLPVNHIVSPAGNPKRWARIVEAALVDDGAAASRFESIHGRDPTMLYVRDLNIANFLDQKSLGQAPTEEPPDKTRTVLLTGATGFLGRFLCLNWLQQLARTGGRLICLVRAATDQAARLRLDRVFQGFDAELEALYLTLADEHLEVIASDVSERKLGLSDEVWARLAESVERIVHPAALVNHRLSYKHLFDPNVLGVAELIRLAATGKQKCIDFVSSAAVTQFVDTSNGNNENSALLSQVPVADHYAAGYGVSKWAAEALLQSAHEQWGLPVRIFRCGMIMPHTRYRGQINVTDMITRLLFSLITTGVAPMSFYELGANKERRMAHYDGLPVDFISEVIVASSERTQRGATRFNVTNPHEDDGISLDTLVDWTESAGYRLVRVVSHERWVRLLQEKLSALPEELRQQSALEIMGFVDKPHVANQPLPGSENFQNVVKRLPVGPQVPHLTEQYIHKYLEDMCQMGLIPPPHEGATRQLSSRQSR